MRRTELLQEIRTMRFKEAYEGWQESRLTLSTHFSCPLLRFCESSFLHEYLTAAPGWALRRTGQPASRLAAATHLFICSGSLVHLFFNVLSIPAVDLDLPFDSRIGLRCRGPVVRAFRPEWDRSGIQGIRSSIVAYRCYTSPMARPLRLEFARALYHVTARGRSCG